jgi:hypothetical protein
MKTLFELLTKPIVYFLFLNLALSSCTFYDDDDNFNICLDGKGAVEKEHRSVRDFTGIELKIRGTVYVQQGNITKLEVESQENLLSHIKTRVSGNNLIIHNDRCFESGQDVKFYITVPDLKKVTVNGSGKVVNTGRLEADNLDLTVSGSGDIYLEVDASDIKSRVSGSGSILLKGQAENHEILISGSGKVDAFGLPAADTEASITGSGKASVLVEDELKVSISGSGQVRYKGNPSIEKHISGSGRVINAN